MTSLLLSLWLAFVQTPPVPGSIEGVVLGSEGRPVKGAKVYAILPPRSVSVSSSVTNDEGRFTISSLVPGAYRIVVEAPGYAQQEYGSPTSGRAGATQGNVITVEAGRSTRVTSMRLTGNAIISGRIANVRGEPLVGVEVSALIKIYDASGMSQLPDRPAVKTDDRGEYRIAGLTPGRYYVHASTPMLAYVAGPGGLVGSDRFSGDTAPLDRSPGRYSPAFYPGVAERDKASVLDVQGSSELKNVDFSLSRPSLFRIRGRVLNPQGIRSSGTGTFAVVPVITDALSLPDMSPISLRSTGEFTLSNIAPGDYWVGVAVQSGGPASESDRGRGYARARVIDGDVDGVEITLLRNTTLSGAVQVEDAGAARDIDVRKAEIGLRMNFASGLPGPLFGVADIQADGTFSFPNLVAMEYELSVGALPSGVYVKSGRFGDTDAMTQPFQLNVYPTPSLNIVLARGVEVTGSVGDAEGKPVSGQQVVFVPYRTPDRVDLYKSASTDANGNFNVSGVAPGDYQVFAWKTLEAFRYFDPEFVRSFAAQATPLVVESTTPEPVRVKLIP